MGHFARECHASRECMFIVKKMEIGEETEGATTGGADRPPKTPTGTDTKNTKEEEATAVTGAEVALPNIRRIERTVLAIVTKRGRKNTDEVTLPTLEDDGTVE